MKSGGNDCLWSYLFLNWQKQSNHTCLQARKKKKNRESGTHNCWLIKEGDGESCGEDDVDVALLCSAILLFFLVSSLLLLSSCTVPTRAVLSSPQSATCPLRLIPQGVEHSGSSRVRLMASHPHLNKVRGDTGDAEIHVSSPPPDDCDTSRPLLLSPAAHEAYSVSAAILPFFFPALGGLLYGYDIGATSGATISLKSSTYSGTTWYNLSSVQIGLVVSGSLYGALIGSALAFTIADFLGRRKELVVASMSYLIGALLTAVAPDFLIMVVGRFLYGIGIGLAMHAAPMYIAETAPCQIRGMLISLKEFFIVLGMLLGYIVGNLFVEVVSGWRYMYATSTPLCVIMGVGMCWLPASPRWLLLCATQGKGNLLETKENATRCLCRLRGQASPDLVAEQVNLILDELSYAGEEKQAGFSEIFQGKCLKAMIIGCGLVFFQQVTGQPSVLYYAATILQSSGFSGASDATRVSILLGLLKLIMTGIAVLVVDRLGRRPLLIGGVSGIALSLFLLSSYYTLLKDAPYVAVIALLLYVGCYQLSFGPIGWLMISEVFPLKLRGRGLSVAVLVNFASNALVTFAFSPLEDLIGTGVLFAAFGVIAVASLSFIFFIVPETKGLTLEEIEASL